MARHNLAFLLGAVTQAPLIHMDKDTGEPSFAHCCINVVRGTREVGDHILSKHDMPLIMSRDAPILREMEQWQEGDIVEIKGIIAAKTIRKGSTCPACGEKNCIDGQLVYVNPIYARKRLHLESQDACIKYLSENREVSNQVYVLGRLCRDPSKVKPKAGIYIAQYQIALNRKYHIRSDPPEIRTDFPWVKSYGENARSDNLHLRCGSLVFVDGCLQARSVQRHSLCEHCGQQYTWRDRALEIVAYDTEYLCDYYTDEDIETLRTVENNAKYEEIMRKLMGSREDDGAEGEPGDE